MKPSKTSFHLLALSQFISIVSGNVLRFSISLHVLDLTGSAAVFATMIAVSSIPFLVLMPLGGAIADRVSKKAIIVVSDIGKTIAVALLFGLLLMGNDSVVLFGAVIAAFSVIQACYGPAVMASLPRILEKDDLAKANGILQGIGALASIGGPILGGLLFGLLGMMNIAAFSAGLFAFSSFINLFIRIPHEKRELVGNFAKAILSDMKQGFVYLVKEEKLLFRACLTFMVVLLFFQAIPSIAAPYIMRITLEMGEESIGIVNAMLGVSLLSASLLAGKFKKYMEMRHLAFYLIFIGLSAVPVALSTIVNPVGLLPPVLLAGGLFITVFLFALTNILVITYVQTNVRAEMLGKVIAMISMTANAAAPAGQITLGLLIETLANVQGALYLGIGAFTVLLGVWSIKRLGNGSRDAKKEEHVSS